MVDLFSDEVFGEFGPGIHYNLSDNDYHSIKAVSNSSLKFAKRSMKHFKWWLTKDVSETQSPQMRFGTLYHMAILQPDVFKKATVMTDAKDKRAKEYKEAKQENPDKYILTRSEVEQITAMATEMADTQHCIRLLKDGAPEVTIFTTDPDTGLKVKARLDFVSTDPERPYILDLKTTTDAKPAVIKDTMTRVPPSNFERHAYNLGYDTQAAFYLDIAQQSKLNAEFYSLIVQETSEPYLCQSYAYGFETIDQARQEKRELLNMIAKCAKDKHWPGYSQKTELITRPWWTMGEE